MAEEIPQKARFVRRSVLCKTLGGLDCDVLTVTNFDIPRRWKKSIVVSARVHPGEANASWICHGILNFLLSQSAEAQVLRDRFVWIIVPLLHFRLIRKSDLFRMAQTRGGTEYSF